MGIENVEDYPVDSTNPFSVRMDFWNDLGLSVHRPAEIGRARESLYSLPVVEYREGYERDVADVREVHEGKIGAETASEIMKMPVDTGFVEIKLIDRNSYPEEVYNLVAEVENDLEASEPVKECLESGHILVEESEGSPGNKVYDVFPVNYRLAREGGESTMSALNENIDRYAN